ncbi:MAG: ATP-dependent DNA helicase RecQ [Verrucomicrobiales bacterium]
MTDLAAHAQKTFGFSSFRPGQKEVMECLLAGRSALAIFPTGAGKSLCYQLPALLFPGTTLVISPLIALMKDQVEALQQRGVAAARLDSSLPPRQVAEALDALVANQLKLLYVAPERLVKESFIERLKRANISMMAVDEAHCISEWGHNFRPEYLRLAHVAAELKFHPILALTATATPPVAEDIRESFHITQGDHVQTSFRRPNLAYRVTPCRSEERNALLLERLERQSGPAIVYVTLQKTAEDLAAFLQQKGLSAKAYHAGMLDESRSRTQEEFMNDQIRCVVATIAFGMGIDKADIRAVYHFNLPKTIENYQQETGRAGRDGLDSVCELLACADDLVVLENFIYGNTPTTSAIRQLVDHLFRQGTEFDISLYELATATDIRPVALETALTHLELQGYLRPLGSFYQEYRVQLNVTLNKILAGHNAERQAFLSKLLTCGKAGNRWIAIEPTAAEEILKEPRQRIVKALQWLEEAGEIQLKLAGLRNRFVLQPGEVKINAITQELDQLFMTHETRNALRLNQVLEFASHTGCLTRWLLGYFGEQSSEDCGTCESCVRTSRKAIPPRREQDVSPEQLVMIHGIRKERPPALRSSRALTRFLCGLSSPAASRARLGKHPAFGLLSEIPFKKVQALIEELGG